MPKIRKSILIIDFNLQSFDVSKEREGGINKLFSTNPINKINKFNHLRTLRYV